MADYSIGTLVALAGRDPWTAAEAVTGGNPAAVTAAGAVFRAAGQQAAEASRLGRTADTTVAAAFTNNGRPVYDAGGSADLTRALLSGDGESMEEVARVLDLVAGELGTAAGKARTELGGLTDTINGIIDRRNDVMLTRTLSPADVDAAERGFEDEAVRAVRACCDAVQRHVDDYDRVLSSRTGYLDDLGYPAGEPGSTYPTTNRPDPRLEGPTVHINVPAPPGPTATDQGQRDPDPRLEGGVGLPIMPGGPDVHINVPAPPAPTATDQGQLGPGPGQPGIVINFGTGATGPPVSGPGRPERGTPTDGVKEQVDPPTLDAARRELKGEVVARRPDGTPFDHVKKVRQAQSNLVKRITRLQRLLGDTRTTPEQRPALEAELSEASKLLDHTEDFVPRP